jgi:hypothetical protein
MVGAEPNARGSPDDADVLSRFWFSSRSHSGSLSFHLRDRPLTRSTEPSTIRLAKPDRWIQAYLAVAVVITARGDSLELVLSEAGGEVGDLPGGREGPDQAGLAGQQLDRRCCR